MRQTIYAAVGIEDDEGIICLGASPQSQITPLLCMDEKTLEKVLKLAYAAHEKTGKTVIVARFDMTEVIERYDGSFFSRPPAEEK